MSDKAQRRPLRTGSSDKFLVVMPSRNREDTALLSLPALAELGEDADVELAFSDNSDSPSRKVEAWCEAHHIHYLRPPSILSMSRHWDWILRSTQWRAITLVSDRSFIVAEKFRRMKSVALATNRAVSWNSGDVTFRTFGPLPMWLLSGPRVSGKAFQVRGQDIIDNLRTSIHNPAMPGLLRSIVHRHEWEAVCRAFPATLSSIGPDSEFGYKFIRVFADRMFNYVDDIGTLYHSAGLSNAAGSQNPEASETFQDFKRLNDFTNLRFSPLPDDRSINSAFVHEYNKVCEELGESWLFDAAALKALPSPWVRPPRNWVRRRMDTVRQMIDLDDREFVRIGVGREYRDLDASRRLETFRKGPKTGYWRDLPDANAQSR